MGYVALIGDLKSSKTVVNRGGVQTILKNVCDDLNQRAEFLRLVSPFTVTLGDEFQAVFSAGDGVWRSIFEFEARLGTVRARFGMGVGALDTAINTESAIGMDGPAFHLAREAVASMKEDGASYRLAGLDQAQLFVRHALDLVSHTRDGWNANRVAIMRGLLNREPVTSIAEKLEISVQAVYKNIRDGQLETLAGMFDGLAELVDQRLARLS